jgi:hypothetical protein
MPVGPTGDGELGVASRRCDDQTDRVSHPLSTLAASRGTQFPGEGRRRRLQDRVALFQSAYLRLQRLDLITFDSGQPGLFISVDLGHFPVAHRLRLESLLAPPQPQQRSTTDTPNGAYAPTWSLLDREIDLLRHDAMLPWSKESGGRPNTGSPALNRERCEGRTLVRLSQRVSHVGMHLASPQPRKSARVLLPRRAPRR